MSQRSPEERHGATCGKGAVEHPSLACGLRTPPEHSIPLCSGGKPSTHFPSVTVVRKILLVTPIAALANERKTGPFVATVLELRTQPLQPEQGDEGLGVADGAVPRPGERLLDRDGVWRERLVGL